LGAVVTWYLKPRASRNLIRHGNAQITVQWAVLAMSMAFWAVAVFSDKPVMEADVYGSFVTVYQAELWAGSIMAASTAYLVGCYINGNWRWSPILRLYGAAWHVFTMGAHAVGAYGVDHTPMFLISATFASLHIWFTFLNVSDTIGALIRWGHE